MSAIPTPLKEVAGKVALITGGSSGIGLGIARACAEAGMKVVITYLTESHRERAELFLRATADEYHSIRMDVSDRRCVEQAAKEISREIGAVHLLCNNAGIGITSPISDASFEDWDDAISVNLGGVVNCIQVFLKKMLASGEPAHVLSTASMSGLFHGAKAGVYTTTKFAVVGMMEALRAEMTPRGVGVSILCPGLVASRIALSSRNRRRRSGEAITDERTRSHGDKESLELMKAGMRPLEIGRMVLEGVRRNDMYIITHPEFERAIRDRCEVLLASIPKAEASPPIARLRAESASLCSDVYVTELDKLMRDRG